MTEQRALIDKILKSRLWPAAWSAFSRTFILLGLALLAWGLGDIAGFISNPVRAGIAAITLINALLLGWLTYRLPPNIPEQKHDIEHWHYSLSELVFILAAYGDRQNALTWAENQPLRWLGLGFFLLGLGYLFWANLTWVAHLRREGERAVEVPALLSAGPYRWTRYPSLLALLVYTFGFTLAFRSWLGLALLLPMLYICLRRVALWEKDNAQRFTKLWPGRARASWRLIPFVF